MPFFQQWRIYELKRDWFKLRDERTHTLNSSKSHSPTYYSIYFLLSWTFLWQLVHMYVLISKTLKNTV